MAGGEIARAPGTGVPAVGRVRGQRVMEGLEAALERRVQADRKKRVPEGGGEAKLTVPACPDPPPGHARRTLKPPGGRLVELEAVGSVSRETVRQTLKKRSGTMAREVPVHPAEGERGLRARHGGRA